MRIQKTAYIKQQLERRRAAEDARLERLLQEQEVIQGLRESIDDSISQTEEASVFFMFAYTAMEGALVSQEKKQYPMLDFICKILYILTFPTMLVMFTCYELKYGEHDLFLPYTVVMGVLVTVFGTISYFLHDPYIQDKKRLRDAQNQIRNIERIAEKEVRKIWHALRSRTSSRLNCRKKKR